MGDITRPLCFVVPPCFESVDDARAAASVHALYGGRLEELLGRLRAEFDAAEWTSRKFAYAEWQGRKIDDECDIRQVDLPVYDVTRSLDGRCKRVHLFQPARAVILISGDE